MSRPFLAGLATNVNSSSAGMSNGARSKHPDPKPSGQDYGDTLFHNESVTDWQVVMNTNVASIYFVTAACLGLLEQGAQERPGETSCVINISSASAHMNLSFNNVGCHHKDCRSLTLV